MRGFFGLAVCSVIGLVSGFATKGRPLAEIRGLVWGTVGDAIRKFYGGRSGQETESVWATANLVQDGEDAFHETLSLPHVQISASLAKQIEAQAGDIVYVSDARWWLGGLKSGHVVVSGVNETEGHHIHLGPNTRSRIIAPGREGTPLKVKRLY